ncbi:unnamed protein product [Sphenostylis stenocarpa]|uniref:Uncharacterized protein n=1 Tax=Sphenostylis stenocarpa TaxID=92480 RepID=A0AA86SCC7_9FABA|nr:unnamed protein product [Sphenostylis stenocarpa]
MSSGWGRRGVRDSKDQFHYTWSKSESGKSPSTTCHAMGNLCSCVTGNNNKVAYHGGGGPQIIKAPKSNSVKGGSYTSNPSGDSSFSGWETERSRSKSGSGGGPQNSVKVDLKGGSCTSDSSRGSSSKSRVDHPSGGGPRHSKGLKSVKEESRTINFFGLNCVCIDPSITTDD